MARPRIRRCLRFQPDALYFKPRGIPLRELEQVVLNADEIEAIKLAYVDALDQAAAAARLHVSQPTFSRILSGACRKVAEAIVCGKAIKIEHNATEPELTDACRPGPTIAESKT